MRINKPACVHLPAGTFTSEKKCILADTRSSDALKRQRQTGRLDIDTLTEMETENEQSGGKKTKREVGSRGQH